MTRGWLKVMPMRAPLPGDSGQCRPGPEAGLLALPLEEKAGSMGVELLEEGPFGEELRAWNPGGRNEREAAGLQGSGPGDVTEVGAISLSLLSPSLNVSLVSLCFLPLGWYHLHILGC